MKIGVFIPVRLAASRFPNKPMADINGKPMMIRVAECVKKAGIEDIIFALPDQELADAARSHGYEYVMTDYSHPRGSDRVWEAYQKCGKKFDLIVNVQGDVPTIEPEVISSTIEVAMKTKCDIATAASLIKSDYENNSPHVVKVILSQDRRALYFTRTPDSPHGDGPRYHHIGLYSFTPGSLKKFVSLPQSSLEKREQLEQLRALENNMSINVAIVDKAPLGVDTKEDLEIILAEING